VEDGFQRNPFGRPTGNRKDILGAGCGGEAEVPVVIQSAALLIDPEQRNLLKGSKGV
jgi:hypothetical protein